MYYSQSMMMPQDLLTDGQIQANGTWAATITLSLGFAAGTHVAQLNTSLQ